MPIYFGRQSRIASASSTAALVPGVDLSRVEPDRSRVFATPSRTRLINHQVVSNMAFLTSSKLEGKPIAFGQSLPMYADNDTLMPIALPDLCVHYPKMGEQVKMFLEAHPHDTISMKKNNLICFRSPKPEFLRLLAATNPAEGIIVPVNNTNLKGMRVALSLLKILTLMFRSLSSVSKYVQTNKRPIGFVSNIENFASVVGGGRELKTGRFTEDLPEKLRDDELGEMPMDIDEGAFCQCTESYDLKSLPYHFDRVKDDRLEGLHFPFVQDLADPDYSLVIRFVSHHCMPFLGDTPEKQLSVLAVLGEGWGIINRTMFGLQIAHLCKVMELCVTCQATLHINITNGSYQGCAITDNSKGFVISVNGANHIPLSNAKLLEDIGESDQHKTALTTIIRVAESKISETDEMDIDTEIKHITSMRSLREFLFKFALTKKEEESIVALSSKLQFAEKFYTAGAGYLSQVLTWVSDPSIKIPTTVPLYHKYLFSQDRIEEAYGAFGPEAPTFTIPGGTKLAITASTAMPTRGAFVVRPVLVELAVANVKDCISSSVIHNFVASHSKKMKERIYNKGEKERIWILLKSALRVPQTAVTTTQPTTAEQGASSILDF